MLYKTYCFAFQKRLFCIAKQPLSQCQIEIIVFLWNYLYKDKANLRHILDKGNKIFLKNLITIGKNFLF